jgi:hypothetical protein
MGDLYAGMGTMSLAARHVSGQGWERVQECRRAAGLFLDA